MDPRCSGRWAASAACSGPIFAGCASRCSFRAWTAWAPSSRLPSRPGATTPSDRTSSITALTTSPSSGRAPLFFLDYIGAERLEPAVFGQILRGFTKACKEAGCALIGGETAQMPGMYQPGEYDLAGTIVGVVDRKKMIDGSRIKPGDLILGLESNGLHTNGYSLARKILFETMGLKPDSKLEGIKGTVGGELLKVHRNYQPLLASIPAASSRGWLTSPAAASSIICRACCPKPAMP